MFRGKVVRKDGRLRPIDMADQAWTTPWEWRDAEDLYIGADGSGWLYRDVSSVLGVGGTAGPQHMDSLFQALAADVRKPGQSLSGGSRRELHLLSVCFLSPIEAPAGTPGPLAEHLLDSVGVQVPTRRLFIGVKLRAGSAPRKSFLTEFSDEVTKFLGQDVPAVSVFDEDRAVIGALLQSHGATAIQDVYRNQLECWYNLGAPPDFVFDVQPDTCYIGDETRVEFAVISQVGDESESSTSLLLSTDLPSPASVISCRGLVTAPHATSRSPRPFLDEVSIVAGHRTDITGPDIVELLQALPGLTVKALEHRQLAGLDETQPCSNVRLHPFAKECNGTALERIGLFGRSAAGDGAGIYLGFTRPDFALSYLNPGRTAGSGMTVLVGAEGLGKTVAARNIFRQNCLAGAPSLYVVSADQPEVLSLALLTDADTIDPVLDFEDGAWDPFLTEPPKDAGAIVLQLLAEQHRDDFTAEQRDQLLIGLSDVSADQPLSLAAVLVGVDPDLAAHVNALARRSPALRLVLADVPPTPAVRSLPTRSILQLDRVPDSGRRLVQRVLLSAARASSVGDVTVFDDVCDLFSMSSTGHALESAARGKGTTVLVTRSLPALAAHGAEALRQGRLMLFGVPAADGALAASVLGLPKSAALTDWLAAAAAETSPPLSRCLFRDQLGRVAVLVGGPLPEDDLDAFTGSE